MNCPRCGRDLPPKSDRCSHCAADVDVTVATGLLTPPPAVVSAPEADDDTTQILPSGAGGDVTAELSTAALPTRVLDARSRTSTPRPARTGGSAGPLEPGQAFGSRYHIIRALGIGGMGAVYQAWDAELGVAVAMKVIRPDVMADPSAAADVERRFKRELLLARQVTHKNVVRIYDLGEIDGIKYITMSYVDGADLATQLKRDGTLPVRTLMPIARQIVAGLVAAHKAGVVHRDLKPANIMIDNSGDALIMDFGIARSAGGPKAESETSRQLPAGLRHNTGITDVTKYGSIVGTIEYMAPEQARGQEVDQRADIYAVGLILYDMLAGRRRAAKTKSAIEELQARMVAPPPPVKTLVPEIPEAIDRIISRCLEPDPAKRFATTEELAAALDRLDDDGIPIPLPRRFTPRLIAVGVTLVAALVTATWWLTRTPPPPKQHEPVSVLIADFVNRTNDPQFDGALEPALTRGVEGASFVSAYLRPDAERLAKRIRPGSTLDEQGSRLVAIREGIKVVLVGSIDRAGGGYRIGVSLIDPATDGKVIKSFTENADAKPEVLSTIDSLALKVRKELGDTNLKRENATSETFTAASLEAARTYTVANDLASQQKYEEAIAQYKKAIELDPNLGRAYSGWAISAGQLGRSDESAELWKRALALVDRMTEREKYRTLGVYYSRVARNQEKAIESFQTLVAKYPGDGAGYNNLALAYFRMLKFDDAYKAGKRLLEIYPKTLLYRNNYVLYAMYATDFQTAAAAALQITKDAPSSGVAYLPLAIAALDAGNVGDAGRAYAEMKKTGGSGASAATMGEADIALYEGRYDDAEALLKQGIRDDQRMKNVAGEAAKLNALADVYLATGREPLAVQTSREALKLGRDPSVVVPAARALIRAGRDADAEAIAADLGASLEGQTRAYGKLLEGEIALRRRKTVDGVEAFRAALKLADLWQVRYALGVAYVAAEHYPEALTELEACYKRRGEASADVATDIPTYRYLAALPYWLGRAQEGVGSRAAATENFKKFVALRSRVPNDPLVVDARKRLHTP